MSESVSGIYAIENEYLIKGLNIEKGKIVFSCNENKLSTSALSQKGRCSEFALRFGDGFFKKTVTSDSLNVKSVAISKEGGISHLCVTFNDFNIKGNVLRVSLNYTLGDGEAFLRKYVTFDLVKKGGRDVVFDSIDLECLPFSSELKSWTLPKQQNSHISGFLMSVGQPVYVDSFYFGCEFPISYNRIGDNKVLITSYSGKKLSDFAEKGYRSYNAVSGVSENDNFATVQKSFYSYIRSISRPVKFRCQYNSWFDNMLNINMKNVTDSFLNVDKGLTTHGTKALDSYVVDDGWNDYGASFWSFNKKFPDGLTQFRALSENLGSRFGLWLGPRGGYTSDTIKFARKVEKGDNGYVNKRAMDICVGSEKYVKKTEELLLGFTDKYNLNYFKLDGFARRPCRNKKHDHLTGGFENMYFFTDVWEKWIAFFEKVYAKNEDFWINLTSYTPPSPWFLQWCNSLWMQISNDIGFEGDKSCDKDRLLTYRDSRYYDFYNIRQFQVPQYALYNHDPIYGNDAKIKMTDGEFRDYLFAMATRGTAFWELYYSHNMFNDAKWRINHSVLSFIEDNMDILSNSVIFGTDPAKGGVYGYSCFGKDEGIVCLRNSSGEKKSYTLVLDENIGAEKKLINAKVSQVIPYTMKQTGEAYSYGDSLTVELNGFEERIYYFGKRFRAMVPTYIKAVYKRTLEVSFNQFVDYSYLSCDENEIDEIQLLEDYMTLHISFIKKFGSFNSYTLKNISDITGNRTDVELKFDYCKHNRVENGLYGFGDFSIRVDKGADNGTVLFKQGDEVSLSVDGDGYVVFKIGIDEVRSRNPMKDGESITAVRERNGVMKIYLGKKLDAGRNSISTALSGNNAEFYGKKVKVYNKALAFDEV